MHLFLTGERQIGKSTLVNTLLSRMPGVCPSGFRTITVPDVPGAIGSVYLVPADRAENACTPESRIGIRRQSARGMETFPESFEHRGIELLQDAEDARLILMDEIGKIEAAAPSFCARVRELLDGDTPILGVLRLEGETSLQKLIRTHPSVHLTTVTEKNRDLLADELTPLLRREIARRTDSAGIIVFRERGGSCDALMIRSRQGWSFPKGHIEFGETEEQAALREVKEETGITAGILPGFRFIASSGLDGERRRIIYYLGIYREGSLTPDLSEISDAAWQPADAVEKLLRFPQDVPPWRAALLFRSREKTD